MTECRDVAESLNCDLFSINSFSQALHLVQKKMPDESYTVINNVAWALYQRACYQKELLK